MSTPQRLIRAIVALALALAAVNAVAPAADAAPRWASASKAKITPGKQMISPIGQCTSNFVFYDKTNVYIAQAAHCVSKGGPTDTNGCATSTLPLGTKIRIEGASKPGILVYNSWITMKAVKEKDEETCLGNDFALVRIDKADVAKVNPSVPYWGGPNGLTRSVLPGDFVYAYGDSGFREGTGDTLSPRIGIATFDDLDGWTHGAYDVPPGIFGDSGSPVLGPTGGALGVFSTISITPTPLQHNAVDVGKALSYMKAHTKLDYVTLAKGTVPFSGELFG